MSQRVRLRATRAAAVALVLLVLLLVGIAAVAQSDLFRRVLVITQPLGGSPAPITTFQPAVTTSGLVHVRPLTSLPLPSEELVLDWRLASADLVEGPFGSFVSLKYGSGDKREILVIVRPLDPQPAVLTAGRRSEVVSIGDLRGLLVYGEPGPAFPRPSGVTVDEEALAHRMGLTVELPEAAVTVVADDRDLDREELIAFLRMWLHSVQ